MVRERDEGWGWGLFEWIFKVLEMLSCVIFYDIEGLIDAQNRLHDCVKPRERREGGTKGPFYALTASHTSNNFNISARPSHHM